MKAIDFIREFGWEKAIEVINGRKSWNDKKSGRLLTDNSYVLESCRYEHAIGTLYMGEFTYYDANSYRSGEVNLLKVKEYTDAYKLVQKFGGLKEAQRLHYDEFRSDKSYNEIQQAITLVEEVGWFEAMNLIKEKINE